MQIPFRGVIVFVLVWAVLWAVPALRVQNLLALHPQAQPYWEGPTMSEAQLASALQKNPNDAFLQSQRIQLNMEPGTPAGVARYFNDYDALIAQHPKDVALWRTRLRLATRGNIVTPRFAQRQVQGPPSHTMEAAWLDAKGQEKVVSQAQAAQRVAPDEAFFPWVEAMALWGLNRKQDSLKALARAGQCPHFNDGTLDETRQEIALLGRYQPLDWDDKLGLSWGVLLPHLAVMRGLTRDIASSATKLYRKGNKAEAWRRWEILLQAGHALRVSQSQGAHATLNGLLVGEAIEQVGWDGAAQGAGNYRFQSRPGVVSTVEEPLRRTEEESLRRSQESLQAFIRAAHRDGHSDLAQWVERDGREIIDRRSSLAHGGNWAQIINREIGWQTPAARLSLQLRWVGFHAMLWGLAGVAAWMFALLMSRGGRDTRVGTSTVVQLSAFFGTLWMGLAVLAVVDQAGIKPYANILMFGADASNTPSLAWGVDWDGNFWWVVALTFVAAMVGREWGAFRLAHQTETESTKTRGPRLAFWKAAGFVAWTLSLVLSLCLWSSGMNEHGLDSIEVLLWVCGAMSVSVGLLAAWQNQKARGTGGKRTFIFAINTALTLGVLALSGRAQHSDVIAWACIVLFPVTLGLWIWSGRQTMWRANIVTNLEVGARVLANVSLIVAVGYLVASLALWPTRNQLNTRIDRYLQLGEVDWLRAQGR